MIVNINWADCNWGTWNGYGKIHINWGLYMKHMDMEYGYIDRIVKSPTVPTTTKYILYYYPHTKTLLHYTRTHTESRVPLEVQKGHPSCLK